MNDRTMIAAMAMQGMLTRSLPADATAEGVANRAVGYADALLKALAETQAERPQFTTSDDHRIIVQATGLGPVEFLTSYPTPSWWGAEPEAGQAKLSEDIIREIRDAWPDRQAPNNTVTVPREPLREVLEDAEADLDMIEHEFGLHAKAAAAYDEQHACITELRRIAGMEEEHG